MNSTTFKAIKALLDVDESVSPQVKCEALSVLAGKTDRHADQSLPLLVSQQEAARLLGVSRFTVRNMVIAGTIQPVRVHGGLRYRRSDIEAMASADERTSPLKSRVRIPSPAA